MRFTGKTALIAGDAWGLGHATALMFAREGAQVISMPVNHRPRTRGHSKYGVHNRLWVGIVDLFGVMWLKRRMTHPMIDE